MVLFDDIVQVFDLTVQLLPQLRDRGFTRVLIVTFAEATPVHEAECLQAGLRRAQIEPYASVINRSLLASGTYDPARTNVYPCTRRGTALRHTSLNRR